MLVAVSIGFRYSEPFDLPEFPVLFPTLVARFSSWNGSSGVAPPSNFGVITTTRANMRQIQLALKYNF